MGGTVSLLAGTEIGNTAKFSCNAGFERPGSESLICGVNGEWSDTPPTCVPVGRLLDSKYVFYLEFCLFDFLLNVDSK